LKPFEYTAPATLEQAVALLAEHGPDARLLAGGTDLLVDLKHNPDAPKVLVDVGKIADLQGIEVTNQGLRIGSAVTHSELMASPLIREHAPAMIDAAHTVGAVQTRNLGTLGGNLVTCVPSMDSGPTLIALDANVTVGSPGGNKEMSLEEFFVGPRKTALGPDEMLVDILIPVENLGKPASFHKFGLRKGQALALVNAAASLRVNEKDGTVVEPRIALGAVAPTVIRARKAEEFLAGQPAGEEAFAEAGRIAVTEAKPIDDFRASADYRRELIAVLARRALEGALAAANA
jgi:CO/xanthine dehydrogenase FAD-binding subunit